MKKCKTENKTEKGQKCIKKTLLCIRLSSARKAQIAVNSVEILKIFAAMDIMVM